MISEYEFFIPHVAIFEALSCGTSLALEKISGFIQASSSLNWKSDPRCGYCSGIYHCFMGWPWYKFLLRVLYYVSCLLLSHCWFKYDFEYFRDSGAIWSYLKHQENRNWKAEAGVEYWGLTLPVVSVNTHWSSKPTRDKWSFKIFKFCPEVSIFCISVQVILDTYYVFLSHYLG